MPATPFSISAAMASAVPIHCSGPMFSLNTPYSFSVSMLQMSASSGTEP